MKNFRINYSFQGKGSVIVKAKNKEEAKNNFHSGENWIDDQDNSRDYEIDTIKPDNSITHNL